MTKEARPIATYATRLTVAAPAAIAAIELSGPSAQVYLQQFWRPATELPRCTNAIRYGAWTGPRSQIDAAEVSGNVQVAEDVVICWTTQDTVEIHCHGGMQAAKRILNDLKLCGAEIQTAHSRISSQTSDPYVAAALIDLEKTTTEITTSILLDQARGALSRAMAEIKSFIERNQETELRTGSTPRSELNNAEVIARISELRSRQRYGLHLTQPWRLAIIGPPNSGKSSLLNVVLGYDRAIVDPTAGTTRDVLNENTSLLGWPFVLVDTAGLRDTNDSIEREGVEKAYGAIETSDIILLLVEPAQGWKPRHEQVYQSHSSKCIAVHSKADLGLALPKIPSDLIATSMSAQTRQGLETLYEIILKKLIPIPPQPGQAVPFRREHIEQLDQWLNFLRDAPVLKLH